MRLSRSAGCTVELSDDPFAASRNLDDDARVDQTRHYEALRAHYGMTPTRNNTGVAHESDAVESQHGLLKRGVLLNELNGSADFGSLEAYRKDYRESNGAIPIQE
jgi:hypothetical protein